MLADCQDKIFITDYQNLNAMIFGKRAGKNIGKVKYFCQKSFDL
jgi:hypothetical protein